MKVDIAKTDEQNFKKLAIGRTDVFFCNETAANTVFSKNKELKDKFLYMKKPLKEVILYMSISKKSELINELPEINKELQKMIDEGFVEEVMKKY